MRLRILIAAALLVASTLATAEGFGDYEPVGFLSDYSKLEHKAGTEAYSWSEPAAQIGAYDHWADLIGAWLETARST
jgi:hypothetical protein